HLIGGKMKQPFFKPGGSTFFWDNDITPEGLAVTYERGIWFGSAYGYWITEISGLETTRTADTQLFGAQVGAKLPIGASTLTLAPGYSDLAAGQGRAPFFNAVANGNTTVGAAPGVLLFDYEVYELGAQFDTMLGSWPLQIWGDFAQNQDPDDNNNAWA